MLATAAALRCIVATGPAIAGPAPPLNRPGDARPGRIVETGGEQRHPPTPWGEQEGRGERH